MTAMFPDSGVPAADARNTILDPNTINCDELWYSTSRCQPRFDPAAANAMLSELINVVNCAGIPYDCTKFDNLCTAIKYLGGTACAVLTAGPSDYIGTLDPPLLAFPSDCCTAIMVIPNVTNIGAVRLNVSGLGLKEVVRNDGLPLEKADWTAGQPQMLIYCGGKWRHLYMLFSQVMLALTGAKDFWVRTDGNDTTGDGSSNDAAHAFKTINGAWESAASRFAVSTIYPINIRLGIPGVYESCFISAYGGPVNIIGNAADRSVYRITPVATTGLRPCVSCADVPLKVIGCTLAPGAGAAGSAGYCAISQNSATMVLDNCQYEITDDNTQAIFTCLAGASITLEHTHSVIGIGGVRQVGALMSCSAQALFWGGTGGLINSLLVQNMNWVSACCAVDDMSLIRFKNLTVTSGGVTGIQYNIAGNSVVNRQGQAIPGTVVGTIASGGQLI